MLLFLCTRLRGYSTPWHLYIILAVRVSCSCRVAKLTKEVFYSLSLTLPLKVQGREFTSVIEIAGPHFCNESNVSALRKIQNKAGRIVTNSPWDASAAPLIQNLGWSTINTLVKKRQPR